MISGAALPAGKSGRVAWQLAQTLWVGGLWGLQFVLLPALDQYGLAPMLIDDIAAFMRPLMVGLAGVCAGLQYLVAWSVLGATVWRDTRGKLLLIVMLLVAAFFGARALPQTDYWQLLSFLLLAFFGLVLVLQPRPDEVVK